jgi:hypothetical protein
LISRSQYPFVELVWAASAYSASPVQAAAPARFEFVSGGAGQRGFVVQLSRRVVEQPFAYFNRSCHLWQVCEAIMESISATT